MRSKTAQRILDETPEELKERVRVYYDNLIASERLRIEEMSVDTRQKFKKKLLVELKSIEEHYGKIPNNN